jgi:hypothetical protein
MRKAYQRWGFGARSPDETPLPSGGRVLKISSGQQPAVALRAWLLFDETLTLIQIAGMLVCAMGVLIVTRGKK